jgi:uncharacterized protein YkwD
MKSLSIKFPRIESYSLNSTLLKLTFVVLISSFLASCAEEEDGIFFDQNSEYLSKVDVTYSDIEIEILDLVNAHRKGLNLSELKRLDIVSSVANTHTNYMIEVGQISHDNFDQRSQTLMKNSQAKKVGENVAYGYSSAKGVVNGWLNSSGHKKVIESTEYTHFGISTDSNKEGRNYFTHIFINK